MLGRPGLARNRLLGLTLLAATLAVAWAVRSGPLLAHGHPSERYTWPAVRPIAGDDPGRLSEDPTQDVTILQRPVRVDFDQEPPGRYGMRAVRFTFRSLTRGDETSVAFEPPLFASEQEMAAFHKRLSTFARAPIVSMRFRGVVDPDSPTYARRWRAVALPYWLEVPCQ